MPLGAQLALTLNLAYEHNLGSTGNYLKAGFADASAPTSFTVNTYGAGQDLFRGGLGPQADLGAGRSAGLSHDAHSGAAL